MTSLTSLLALVAIICSGIVYILIARQSARELRSVGDFLLYRRRLHRNHVFGTFFASGMSLATVFIAFMQLAPILGVRLLWAALFYALGHVVLWLTIPTILRQIPKGITLHGFLSESYDSNRLRLIASTATTIGFIGIFSVELIVGSHILNPILGGGESYWVALVFISLLVISYAILGGFRSVVKTDIVQSLLVIGVCGLIVYLGFKMGRDTSGELIPAQLTAAWVLPPLMMVNFFLINVPFPLVDMSAWQRVIASRSSSVARQGVSLAIVFFLITWGAILLGSLALSEFAASDQAGGLPTVLISFAKSGGVIAPLVMAVAFAALIAAMLSTSDTFLIAAGQTVAMDISEKDFFETHPIENGDLKQDANLAVPMDKDHQRVIQGTRTKMAIFGIVGILACIFLTKIGFGIAELVFAVYGSCLALFPAVGLALWKRGKWELSKLASFAIWSVSLGFASGWVYGIISVWFPPAGQTLPARILKSIDFLPGDPSPYNAPTIAIGIASVVMIAGLIAVRPGRKH